MDWSKTDSWVFKEAWELYDKIGRKTPDKGYVLFETGYGPSGFPHIGTFAEIIRTSMVRKAFTQISNIKTKLFCVSDDMDALKKVPTNIPNYIKYQKYLDRPLTSIPDPFAIYNSYGDYMNVQLTQSLDNIMSDYEFVSATHYYKTGYFNHYLHLVLKNYQAILDVILPTLGLQRRATYSPFLPICPYTGKVLQVKVIRYNPTENTIVYLDPEHNEIEISILNGKCKLQWKVDFAMRWAAFNVDYEIYGKDIKDNAILYAATNAYVEHL